MSGDDDGDFLVPPRSVPSTASTEIGRRTAGIKKSSGLIRQPLEQISESKMVTLFDSGMALDADAVRRVLKMCGQSGALFNRILMGEFQCRL